VHVDDPCMSEKMEQAARKMNLKGHMAGIGDEKKLIYGPTDIEASPPSSSPTLDFQTKRFIVGPSR